MGIKDPNQYVDPDVTRIKFEKEIQEFKAIEEEYRRKGIICTKIVYPNINLLFAIPHIKPQPIAFAVKINYTNWDVEPPSITFIDSFSEEVLNRKEIKINFYQVKDKKSIRISPNGQIAEIDLVQGVNGIKPFFCIPGVREYHQHPAHSGDSWMLHRTMGEGKLSVLIQQLYRHSIAQAAGYAVSLQINISGIQTDLNKLRL